MSRGAYRDIIIARKSLPAALERLSGKRVVFTNGVFDILHAGHVEYLAKAKALGDILIVGVNRDSSVRRIKGPGRPLQAERDRAIIVAALKPVDYVVLFAEDTPERLIKEICPDVLAKGADYAVADIVGADFVLAHGGEVRRIALKKGRSSSSLIEQMGS
jgi:rfaE bifunctional protein nucleotidyltransferase chain/domain